jgi:hypothetical protein
VDQVRTRARRSGERAAAAVLAELGALADDHEIAAIPGTSSAWMVGAWLSPHTGLTGEVLLSQ